MQDSCSVVTLQELAGSLKVVVQTNVERITDGCSKIGLGWPLPRLLATWPRIDYCMQPIVQHAADVSALIHYTGCVVLFEFCDFVPYLAPDNIFLQLRTILAKPCSSRYVEDLFSDDVSYIDTLWVGSQRPEGYSFEMK
jgi:hypothetical protein